jgi:ferredoxin-NADP reductase
MLIKPQKYSLRLVRKEKISDHDAYSFYFRRTDGFDFYPGQYMRWTIEKEFQDDRGKSRYFTIASSPTEDLLMVTTKIIKSNFKQALTSLKIGDHIVSFGPFGSFVLDELDKTPRVFIAGGIGITPFRSMAIYARDKKLSIPITFFASFSTVEETVYYDELKAIEDILPHFKYIPTITKPEESKSSWNGEEGRLDIDKIRKYVSNPQDPIYYIAGPTKMVEALVELVKSLGVDNDKIKFENFPGY